MKRLYKIAEINRNDENIGANPTKILVRKTNARLTLSHEDTSDMESVPILQIIPSAGENLGRPKMAPDYIPPCYSLSGSAVLRELLMGIASQVQTSRNELVPQINHGGFSFDHIRGTQFEQIFRLQTLNRYAAVLNPLVKAPNGVSPFQMYLLLRQLQAELAALSPEADPFETIDYDHDNLTLVFNNLAEKIKDLLKSSVKSNYLKIDFTYSDQFKAHLAEIKEEHLTRSNEYFLAIETKEDPQVLVPYVMDRDKFKLMPKSLMNQRIFGVSLEYEQHFPVELPSTPGRYYFRLNRSESQRIWGRIEQEKGLAVKWPSVETVDYKLKLFMTIS